MRAAREISVDLQLYRGSVEKERADLRAFASASGAIAAKARGRLAVQAADKRLVGHLCQDQHVGI